MPELDLITFGVRSEDQLDAGMYFNGGYIGFMGISSKFLYLQKCGKCSRENWGPAVQSGVCAWCGWDTHKVLKEQEKRDE